MGRLHRLKILYVLPSFTLGGTETHLLRLIDGLRDKGYEVSVCFLYKRFDIIERLAARGIKYNVLGMASILDLRGAFRFFRLLKKEKFDIVHAYLFDASIYAPLVARLAGVKAVFTSRRNYDDWMKWHHVLVQRFANLFTDMVFVNSERVKNFVVGKEALLRQKVTNIYNSIEKDRFSKCADGLVKEKIGLRKGDIAITKVAKFKRSKGHGFLLEAAKKVIEKIPNAKFVLVGGEGDLQPAIRKQAEKLDIKKNIVFAGETYNTEDILSVSDICVLSSIREGFSNALMEYMAAGKAIVATDVGGNSEVIDNEVNGLLVPSRDPEKLSDAIISLIGDKEKREKFGNAAKERISDIEFEPEYMSERFNALYRETLNVNTAKDTLTARLKRKLTKTKDA